jgi:hypothetical protein
VAEVVAEDTPVAVADLMDSHEEFREVEFTEEDPDVGMADILKVGTIMEDITTVAMVVTFIEDMHHQVPYLELF